jgi:hypothetical protein
MSLRVRLARFLTGQLPQPNVHQLRISLLRPGVGRVTVPKLCWPKVHGGIVPAIGRSVAVTKLRWTSLESATVSRAELHCLPLLPTEVKRHSELLVNLASAESRMLEERGSLPEVYEPRVGHPGDARSIKAAAEAQPEHDKEPCGEAPEQFTPSIVLGDRYPSLLEVPIVPQDKPPRKGAEPIVAPSDASTASNGQEEPDSDVAAPTIRSNPPNDDRSGELGTPVATLQGLPEETSSAMESNNLNGSLPSQDAPIPATRAPEPSTSDLSQACCDQSEDNALPPPLPVSRYDDNSGIQTLASEMPATFVESKDSSASTETSPSKSTAPISATPITELVQERPPESPALPASAH